MVDILEASGARRPKPGLAATPASTVSAAQQAAPYTELAKAVGALGETLSESTGPYQAAEGAKSVSKDADGNIQVGWRAEFSQGDKLYNAAARQAALASGKTDIDRELLALRNQFDGKPAEYQAAAKGFVKEVGKGGDALLRPFLQAEAERQAGQYFEGLVSSKHDMDLRRSLQSLTAREGLLADELESLASQGGAATEDFHRKRIEIDDLRSQKAANPKLLYTPEQRKVDDARLDIGLKAAGIVGMARRDYERDGDLARAQRTAEGALDALPIPLAEKLKYLGQVSARLSGQHAMRQAELAETKEEAQSLGVLFGQGQRVDLKRYDEVVGKLRSGKAYAAAYNLEAAKVTAETRPTVRYGTAAEATAALERVQAGGIGGGEGRGRTVAEAGPSPARAFLVSKLSGNSEAHVDGLREGFASSLATMFQEAPAGIREGLGILSGFRSVERQRELYEASDKSGKMVAAPGRSYHNHGEAVDLAYDGRSLKHAPKEVQDWVAANAGKYGLKIPMSYEPWHIEPASTRGGEGGGVGGNPMLPEVVKALQATLNERTKESWASVRKALDDGLSPSAKEVDDLRTLLPKVSDLDLRKEIASRLGIEEAKQSVAGMPLRDRENLTAVSREAARQGNASAVERDVIAAWQKQNDELRKVMTEEPTRYGAVDQTLGLPVPKPLDLSSADAFRASLGERQVVLGAVKQLNPEAPDIVLDGSDRAQLGAVLAQADAPTATMLVGTIAQLPPAQRGAVMSDNGIKDALVGMSRSGDPGKMSIAFSVLDAERRRDPIAFGKTYGPTVEDRLEEWTARMSMLPVQDLAREMTQVDDPARMKARDALRKEAETKVAKVTPRDVAGYFDESYLPFTSPPAPAKPLQAGVLKADFDQEFARFYAVVGDEGKARELAIDRLKRVWGPSVVNGGRLTKFAPEKSATNPPINGSHGWLVQQLDEDVRGALYAMGAHSGIFPATNAAGAIDPMGSITDPTGAVIGRADTRPMGELQNVEVPGSTARLNAPRMLVPDARTEAEFNSGRPPSYSVVLQAPNGMYVPLQDSQGRALRFVGDVERAMVPVRERAQAAFQERELVRDTRAASDARNARRFRRDDARRAEAGQ